MLHLHTKMCKKKKKKLQNSESCRSCLARLDKTISDIKLTVKWRKTHYKVLQFVDLHL